MKIKNGTTRGWLTANEGDSIILRRPTSENIRGRVQHGITPTLCTGGDVGVIIRERDKTTERIRTLTEREYWRLMGFSDDDFDKAAEVSSKAQLYKQAGNSIVVPVLEAIFRELYLTEGKKAKLPTLDAWTK